MGCLLFFFFCLTKGLLKGNLSHALEASGKASEVYICNWPTTRYRSTNQRDRIQECFSYTWKESSLHDSKLFNDETQRMLCGCIWECTFDQNRNGFLDLRNSPSIQGKSYSALKYFQSTFLKVRSYKFPLILVTFLLVFLSCLFFFFLSVCCIWLVLKNLTWWGLIS